MNTAAKTYTAKIETVSAQLEAIKAAIEAHKADAGNEIHWGHVGDMGAAEAKLAEVLAFLSGE